MKKQIAKPKILVVTKNPADKVDNRISVLSAILGPRGIKPIEFLKEFDQATSKYDAGTEIIVEIIITDLDPRGRAKKYHLNIGTPSVSFLVKKYLNITKMTEERFVDKAFVDKIIQVKKSSFPNIAYESIFSSIVGTLKSMKIYLNKE